MNNKPKRRRARARFAKDASPPRQNSAISQEKPTAKPKEPDKISLELLRGNKPEAVIPRVRWYRGYRSVGSVHKVLQEVKRHVEDEQLTDIVKSICFQKDPAKEFYFFLALETNDFGYFPNDVRSRLEECRHLKNLVEKSCPLDDIKDMVSCEIKFKNFAQTIAYRKLKLAMSANPFERVEETQGSSFASEMVDKLLYFLSAQGWGNRSAFNTICKALDLESQTKTLLRNLRLLGHLEMDSQGKRWSVNPTSSVQVLQCNQTMLIYALGARDNSMQGTLQSQYNAPSRLVMAEHDEYFANTIKNPALEVAKVAPTIKAYLQNLASVGGISENLDTFRKLAGNEFVVQNFQREQGMYEVKSRSGRTTTLLYNANSEKWVEGEWYALRYIHHCLYDSLLPCRYDAERWCLAIPKEQRPPLLYERILVLASGYIPSYSGNWLVYHNIMPPLVEIMLEKLAMNYETTEVEVPNE